MLHFLFGTNYPPLFVHSPQMLTQCHSHHFPYLNNIFLSISRHIFSFSPFLPRLLLYPSPSTFLTSHCPFFSNLSSARKHTSVSWFCGHCTLSLSIYLHNINYYNYSYNTKIIRITNTNDILFLILSK